MECGIENLTILRPREEFPDSVFVEDAALALPTSLLISQPGAASRRGEFTEDMREAFEEFYAKDKIIEMTGN